MPKSTVQEENPYKLPEDVYLPVRLLGVTASNLVHGLTQLPLFG